MVGRASAARVGGCKPALEGSRAGPVSVLPQARERAMIEGVTCGDLSPVQILG